MLSGSMVASSFGKLVMKENPRDGVREEDLALALLMMITNNIGQVAYLNAQLFQCNKIFFVGSFLRHNPISCRRLAFAIDFWSAGNMEALFLVHEGYFGALGTFLHSAFGDDVDKVLRENERHHPVEETKPTTPSKKGDSSKKANLSRDTSAETVEGEEPSTGNNLGAIRRLSKNLAEWSKKVSSPSSNSKENDSLKMPTSRRGRSSSDDFVLRNPSK
jgi:hypothetical protein